MVSRSILEHVQPSRRQFGLPQTRRDSDIELLSHHQDLTCWRKIKPEMRPEETLGYSISYGVNPESTIARSRNTRVIPDCSWNVRCVLYKVRPTS